METKAAGIDTIINGIEIIMLNAATRTKCYNLYCHAFYSLLVKKVKQFIYLQILRSCVRLSSSFSNPLFVCP